MHRFFIYPLLIFCAVTVFVVRLHVDESNMSSSKIENLTKTQREYATSIRIVDDPEIQPYSVNVVAIDEHVHRRVLVRTSGDVADIFSSARVGDVFSVKGHLVELSSFNRYRHREHIVGEFSVRVITGQTDQSSLVNSVSQIFRNRILGGCSHLSINKRGVCEGIIVGERNHISKDLYRQYVRAQLTHLLVASGANIAFLVGFVSPLISRRSRRTQAWVLCGIALFYCVVTRGEPSILRACVMVVIPQILLVRGYRFSALSIFATSLTACLFLDPFLVYRVGFWLSVSATAGLRFVSPLIHRRIKSLVVSNTLGAAICVQPFLWLVFGFRLPTLWWMSVIAVMIAEPLSTVGMVLVVCAGYMAVGSLLSDILIFPVEMGVGLLNFLAGFQDNPSAHVIGCVCSVLVIIAYTYRGRRLRSGSDSGGPQCILYYR